ncbi:MAG: MFS transporter [Acidobacteria bacterium]|nr:MAG: MFS transporter [Acidobacteriota bacterium]
MVGRVIAKYREAYSGLPKGVWMLAGVEFVNRAGTMVLFFLTLYTTRHLGFSLPRAGQILAAYGMGSLIGTYLGGHLCDRIGAYHVQRLSLGFSAIFLILLGLPESFAPLMVLAFLLGAAAEALHPANLTAVSQLCPPEMRTRGFSLSRLAANLGLSIGPVVGGYLALFDYKWLFWADGLTSLVALGLFHAFFATQAGPASAHYENARPERSPWSDRVFLLIWALSFLVAVVFSQLFATFPLYIREVYQLKENAIGQLIAVNTVQIVLIEMLIIHALRGHEPARVARVGVLALCAGFALMPLGRGFLYGAFTVVVWTFGEILTLPLLVTLVAGRAGPTGQGRYQGLLTLSFALATIVGPLVGSWVYNSAGPDTLWFGCGVLGIVLAAGFTLLIAISDREK